ncbi:MAG: nucleotidyl transferase AbiEii/AbiGii toxin family protein [Candidatus Gracilibacteria bacterium]|nr:nucleotidyl transferase AbiEii/AbiGii toxin family protein [Candidatus Gracilibacteria bacterium]
MNKLINLYLKEVLDKNRLEILENLIYFKDMGFVLGGGTGLALIFGHRTSIDFDFFINQDIDNDKLFLMCLEVFKGFEISKIYEEKNTLYILVNGVKISFFTYNYNNLYDIIETYYFNIYSIQDIGAMKLWAIQNRATNKDYVDLFYIINEIGLNNLIDIFFLKFGKVVTKTYILKSLVYFDDIKIEKLILTDKKLNFEKIKNFLIKETKNISNN